MKTALLVIDIILISVASTAPSWIAIAVLYNILLVVAVYYAIRSRVKRRHSIQRITQLLDEEDSKGWWK